MWYVPPFPLHLPFGWDLYNFWFVTWQCVISLYVQYTGVCTFSIHRCNGTHSMPYSLLETITTYWIRIGWWGAFSLASSKRSAVKKWVLIGSGLNRMHQWGFTQGMLISLSAKIKYFVSMGFQDVEFWGNLLWVCMHLFFFFFFCNYNGARDFFCLIFPCA